MGDKWKSLPGFESRLPPEVMGSWQRWAALKSEPTFFELAIATLTLWGEARGEGSEGLAAVAHVIKNRIGDKRWPSNVVDVVLTPYQFSCWNPSPRNVNLPKMLSVSLSDPKVKEVMGIAAFVLMTDLTADVTSGANHYLYWKKTQNNPPAWYSEDKVTEKIKRHIFLQL